MLSKHASTVDALHDSGETGVSATGTEDEGQMVVRALGCTSGFSLDISGDGDFPGGRKSAGGKFAIMSTRSQSKDKSAGVNKGPKQPEPGSVSSDGMSAEKRKSTMAKKAEAARRLPLAKSLNQMEYRRLKPGGTSYVVSPYVAIPTSPSFRRRPGRSLTRDAPSLTQRQVVLTSPRNPRIPIVHFVVRSAFRDRMSIF